MQQLSQPQLQQERQENQQNQQDEGYESFMRHLTMQQEIPVNQQAQPAQENLGTKERKKQEKQRRKQEEAAQERVMQERKELEKQMAENPRLMSYMDVKQTNLFATRENWEKWSNIKPAHSKLTLRQIMEQVNNGDYSNFENLDLVMRNMFAQRALGKLSRDYIPLPDDPADLCEQIKNSGEGVSALLDPALRLGLSLAQRTEGIPQELKDYYRKLDEAMSTAVMVETLTKNADEQTVRGLVISENASNPNNPPLDDATITRRAREKIEVNKVQQIQIAKRLLLMQLSTFSKMTEVIENGKKSMAASPWDKSMAVALSHCSRVVLTMPAKEKKGANSEQAHKRMWGRIFYQTHGTRLVNNAQDNSRGSSTHSIAHRKVKKGDDDVRTSREKKVPFNLVGQRGMNCAIGGLGNAGVSGQLVNNNGSCGHFYSMYKEASSSEYGVMLMGLESDANGVTNQMGHTHDIHATPEKASSLGGQRTDEVGAKYGGRQCDLSHMSAEDIGKWMLALENKMTEWQNSDGGMSNPEAVRAMQLLAGNKITSQEDKTWLRDTLGLGSGVGGM